MASPISIMNMNDMEFLLRKTGTEAVKEYEFQTGEDVYSDQESYELLLNRKFSVLADFISLWYFEEDEVTDKIVGLNWHCAPDMEKDSLIMKK